MNAADTLRAAARQFPTCDIATARSGPLTVPCQPLNDWLAITPSVAAGEPDDMPVFTGGFQVTHRPTGWAFSAIAGCLNCARAVGKRLGEIGEELTLVVNTAGVEIERVAPANWPPQPGDVWRDRGGSPWFALVSRDGAPILTDPRSTGPFPADEVAREEGPLTLAYRPEPAATTPSPATGAPRVFRVGDTIPGNLRAVVDKDGDTWNRRLGGAWGHGDMRRTSELLLDHYGPVTEIPGGTR